MKYIGTLDLIDGVSFFMQDVNVYDYQEKCRIYLDEYRKEE